MDAIEAGMDWVYCNDLVTEAPTLSPSSSPTEFDPIAFCEGQRNQKMCSNQSHVCSWDKAGRACASTEELNSREPECDGKGTKKKCLEQRGCGWIKKTCKVVDGSECGSAKNKSQCDTVEEIECKWDKKQKECMEPSECGSAKSKSQCDKV